jgi:hypothetical protein
LGARKAQALRLDESPQIVLEVEAMVDLNRSVEEIVAEPTQESACEGDLVSWSSAFVPPQAMIPQQHQDSSTENGPEKAELQNASSVGIVVVVRSKTGAEGFVSAAWYWLVVESLVAVVREASVQHGRSQTELK